MLPERPSLLIAATIADATSVKRKFRQFSTWQVMTPRNETGRGWLYGRYIWTPEAQSLPATVRWTLRQRLKPAIDEHSEEQDFPTRVLSW